MKNVLSKVLRIRLLLLFIGMAICVAGGAGTSVQAEESKPTGEVVGLAQKLSDLMGAYAFGVWPDADSLDKAVSFKELPADAPATIEASIRQVVKVPLVPATLSRDSWIGIRKLRWSRNVILGSFDTNEAKSEFQSTKEALYLTFQSKTLVPQDTARLDEAKVRSTIGHVLNVPQEKLEKSQINMKIGEIEGKKICYGTLRCEFNDDTPSSDRKWFSQIPFWIMGDKIFVAVSTVDWQSHGEKASARVETWEF